MALRIITALSMLLIAGASSQLLCYHCDDCNLGPVVVQPCGFDQPMIPGSSSPTGTWPESPIITPPSGSDITAAPEFPTGQPILTPPPPNLPGGSADVAPVQPWEPNLTPPNHPGTDYPFLTSTSNGGALITPPVTPFERINEVDPQWNNQFVCMTVETVVNNRQIVRRGCARQEINNDATCSSAAGANSQRCTICATNLCNWES
ncbi:uncharacterized protein LOC129776632 [Toxorhynchites rutilus septentrionalis]|uniref:uncharacterized protein LOC129776632 n=1 Tax=Toxorhynchites rutilus septentrionalis TaxID=329112 RepID=UPI00247A229A|nr:uncharacterized protein LOC129776632 [Toxorhynchites rutilus septentrionalis]